MKVYAVIERCDDDFYPYYMIKDDKVYLKKEDAEKRLKEIKEEDEFILPECLVICEFEVKE